jgi:polyferredoxin
VFIFHSLIFTTPSHFLDIFIEYTHIVISGERVNTSKPKGFFQSAFFRRKIWIRRVVQIFFFALIALISVNHTLVESGKGIPFLSSASLHSICPFGGVETLYKYLTTGTFVQKVHEASFVLMIIVLLTALLFGPVFCGWVCPLGTFQEWIAGLAARSSRNANSTILFLPNWIGCCVTRAIWFWPGWST